jgi:hypothetical protein
MPGSAPPTGVEQKLTYVPSCSCMKPNAPRPPGAAYRSQHPLWTWQVGSAYQEHLQPLSPCQAQAHTDPAAQQWQTALQSACCTAGQQRSPPAAGAAGGTMQCFLHSCNAPVCVCKLQVTPFQAATSSSQACSQRHIASAHLQVPLLHLPTRRSCPLSGEGSAEQRRSQGSPLSDPHSTGPLATPLHWRLH